MRKSLGTNDWDTALARVCGLDPEGHGGQVPLEEAFAAFEVRIGQLKQGSQRKYRGIVQHLREFCRAHRLTFVVDVTTDKLELYRATRRSARDGRPLGRLTAAKELETLRAFFRFCAERDWLKRNPADTIRGPRDVRSEREVAPYTPEELMAILGACERFGRHSYERLRARAMLLLLRHTGLRISDVVTLGPERITPDGRLLLRTLKNGRAVYLPLPGEMLEALAELPEPKRAVPGTAGYFWSRRSSAKAAIASAQRTLAKVFRLAGVAAAYPHRFRHTLATELLGAGGTMADVADVLGITEQIARRHYAKWSSERQDRIDRLMRLVRGETPKVVDIRRGA